jgi:hypothetical protein
MKRLLVAMTAFSVSPAMGDDMHPPFLQAAIFFMRGFEPPNIVLDGEKRAWGVSGLTRDHEFWVEEDKPCILEEFDKNGEIFNAKTRMYETAPMLKWLNFAKLPSPRQAIFFQTAAVFRPLPNLTYCSTPAEPDSSALDPKPKGKFFNCSESFTIFG